MLIDSCGWFWAYRWLVAIQHVVLDVHINLCECKIDSAKAKSRFYNGRVSVKFPIWFERIARIMIWFNADRYGADLIFCFPISDSLRLRSYAKTVMVVLHWVRSSQDRVLGWVNCALANAEVNDVSIMKIFTFEIEWFESDSWKLRLAIRLLEICKDL